MQRRPLLLGLLGGVSELAGAADPPLKARILRVCTNASLGDERGDATPFLMMRRVQDLLPRLHIEYTPLPWARCLQEASQGQFDGVLAASHTPERAQHLRYPSDARGETDESKRMFLVGYALLRHRRGQAIWDGMRFSGTQAHPGQALGAERGYSVVQFARERGAHMEERSNLASLLASVRLGRLQGALLSQEHATRLLAEPEWSEYEMVGPTVASKAYYLPVSARLAEQDPHWVAALWQAITQVRRSPEFASEFSLALSAGQRRDLKP